MDPFFNFALEYYFMTQRRPDDGLLLFWRVEPTLMIGRNQNTQSEIDEDFARRNGIHIVRRLSGGGTIYTDENTWQYSFIVPKSKDGVDFKPYTDQIVATLCKLGVPAYFSGRNDILVSGRKISGSAQYIGRDVLLHHGSLLFGTDLERMAACLRVPEDKLASKGVRSVSGRVCTIAEFMKEKTDAVGFKEKMLQLLMSPQDGVYALTPEDTAAIHRLAAEKFRPMPWSFDSEHAFSHVKSKRLEGGKIEFRFDLEAGHVSHCRIFGDFFLDGEVEAVEVALTGCLYEKKAVLAALKGVNGVFYQMDTEELAQLITQ